MRRVIVFLIVCFIMMVGVTLSHGTIEDDSSRGIFVLLVLIAASGFAFITPDPDYDR